MPTIKYRLKDGTPVQGVTTIKGQNIGWGKSPLMWWANKQGLEGKTLQESYDTATVPGTIAHYLIECYLKKISPDLSPWSSNDIDKGYIAYNNFIQWTKHFEFKPILVEPNLISDLWKFGGTPDVIGDVLGKRAIIDWKTGKIYEDLFLQLAAYKILNDENYPDTPIDGGFHCLRIPKNEDIPSFHHSYWEKLPDEAWKSFKCAMFLSKYQKVLKQLL
jgi:hypothetical protein